MIQTLWLLAILHGMRVVLVTNAPVFFYMYLCLLPLLVLFLVALEWLTLLTLLKLVWISVHIKMGMLVVGMLMMLMRVLVCVLMCVLMLMLAVLVILEFM